MSRCFPYPPPGYTREGIASDALIETIKLQREAEKAKKEKKREKRKTKKEGEGEHKKHERKKRPRGNEEGAIEKKAKHEPLPVEKSTVTEEFTNPSNSQISFNSEFAVSKLLSDNKQNSEFHVLESKDKKQALGIELPYERNVFRIRFPVPKELGAETVPPCSTSAIGDVPETFSKRTPDPVYEKYLSLVANWVPEEELGVGEADTGWLMNTHRADTGTKSESVGCARVMACHSAVPRAQYLADAGLYVMPYTIPF